MDTFDEPGNSPVPDVTDEEVRRSVVWSRRAFKEIIRVLKGDDMGTPGILPTLVAQKATIDANRLAIEALSRRVDGHDSRFYVWGSVLLATVGIVTFLLSHPQFLGK